MQKLVRMLACFAILMLAGTGCEKKGGEEANQPGGGGQTTTEANKPSAMAPSGNLDQIRQKADSMSESDLRQSAQRVSSEFQDIQNQISAKMDQIRSGGMIAGANPQQLQQDVQQLRQKAQNLRSEYQIYASKLQEKGVQAPPLSQSTTPSQGGQQATEANQPGSQAQQGTTEANQPGGQTQTQGTTDANQSQGQSGTQQQSSMQEQSGTQQQSGSQGQGQMQMGTTTDGNMPQDANRPASE